MKRLVGYGLATCMLAFVGCFTGALPESVVQPAKSASSAKALPNVTPEQVSGKNGHQIAQALDEEMTREEQRNTLSAVRP